MEGDAGTGQLSSSDADDTKVTSVDSAESADGTDEPDNELTSGTDQADLMVPVGDAAESSAAGPHPSRLGRGWLVGIGVALIIAAGAVGAGGYLALRAHRASEAADRADAAALKAAKECITAMNAPDAAAMDASLSKVIECTTEDLAGQIQMFSLAIEAYEKFDIHSELLDLRAAVERNNDDGSIDILAALRVYLSTTGEQSQRLRVTMRFVDDQYKIAKMDWVGR